MLESWRAALDDRPLREAKNPTRSVSCAAASPRPPRNAASWPMSRRYDSTLVPESAASVRADDAMARDHQGERIRTACLADRAWRRTQRPRHRAVGQRATATNRADRLPDAALERRARFGE